ncbi:hypothetical protein PYH37_006154 (plasmid) [Sinorhizobium numidicum]|uniref:Secreted protein n=1 Tax=Sinorhizobium numidicum TaxID=680248 RepID=A0ABY8D364_9HYPH|nr:hypothetical protein [Sinorhizobium numidicum]WEX79300.1 hypothetical protein PYH37_006154 [Sinorhizobium numidicum]WEX85329.1 hypothetical protein PYH38_006231 [Sinorhizobium numidicum]
MPWPWRGRSKLSLWIAACVLIPLWTSVLVRSCAWIILLQRRGVLNDIPVGTGIIEEAMKMIYTEGAVDRSHDTCAAAVHGTADLRRFRPSCSANSPQALLFDPSYSSWFCPR